jgi:hypothetical protein
VAAGNVASAVSNAALIAWQLPCRASTMQTPGILPAARNSAATGTLPHVRASFSTMTTAKRRAVRWEASDSSVTRKCCGRRKEGIQTTIPIEVSSDGDAAANARDPCVGAVAKSDSSDNATVREISGPATFTAATEKSHRKCASIDMPAPRSVVGSKDMCEPLQYPVQQSAAQTRLPAMVNGTA